MEIDKKIILRLIQTLEDLKKSLKGIEIDTKDESAEEEIKIAKMEEQLDWYEKELNLNPLSWGKKKRKKK